MLAGAFWGFIPGFLKARTGAHEVITTIMLNYIAAQIVFFALRSDDLRRPGSTAPVSRPMSDFVDIPLIINLPAIRLDYGFVIALLMAGGGVVPPVPDDEGLRAAGRRLQPDRRALRRHERGRLDDARDGPVGRAGRPGRLVPGDRHRRPAVARTCRAGSGSRRSRSPCWRASGRVASSLAALLFGALTSGGKSMGIESGIPVDLLVFIMALVIMFVAAPNLIRSIWRLKVVDPAKEAVAPHQPTAPI